MQQQWPDPNDPSTPHPQPVQTPPEATPEPGEPTPEPSGDDDADGNA